MACGAQLKWYDMLPVVSWIVLQGKCRRCHTRISIQYPLVEAVTAILFGLVGASSLLFLGKILGCVIAAVLIAIAVYDIRHTIIPDAWVWSFNFLALFSIFVPSLAAPHSWLLAILAGPIAASPLFALWLFSRGQWMGLGDVKLALGIGWLLGHILGIVAVFFAFVVGAVVSVGILLPLPYLIRTLGITSLDKLRGGFTMRSEIPFGPFLIFSCIIIWFASIYGLDPLQAFGLLSLTTF